MTPRSSSGQAGGEPGNAVVAIARQIRKARQDRFTFLSPELLGEPAWDLLLDLFIAGEEGRSMAINQLCGASGVAASTTLRWLKLMVEEGYLERAPLIGHAGGQLALTRATRDRLTMFLAAVERAAHPTV